MKQYRRFRKGVNDTQEQEVSKCKAIDYVSNSFIKKKQSQIRRSQGPVVPQFSYLRK
jgi:hypothetical protein